MSNTKQTLRLMIADKLYRCLFGAEGGMKLKQLVKTLDDKDITPELAYDIMRDDPRFETVQQSGSRPSDSATATPPSPRL